MSRIRALTLAALAALLGAAAVGCGGGDDRGLLPGQPTKAQYVEQVRGLVVAFQRKNREVREDGVAKRLATMTRTFEVLAQGLDSLEAPVEARQAHADLVAGVSRLGDLLAPTLEAVAGGDAAMAEFESRQDVGAVRARLLAAREWFLVHGYDLGFDPSLTP